MGFANAIIGGAAALIRAAIRSPNFVTGVSGWSVNKDGSAEFSDLTARGNIVATEIAGIAYVRASGDISGVTDANNINSALSGATPVVQLIPGTYYINRTLVIPSSKSLVGTGPAAVNVAPGAIHVMPVIIILVSGSNTHMVEFAGNNCYLGSVELDGNQAGQSAGFGTGLLIDNLFYCQAEKVFIHDQRYYGVSLVNSLANKIYFSSISSNGNSGISIDSSSDDNEILGCYIANNGADNIVISGFVNHLLDCDIWGSAANGVTINGGRGNLVTNCGIDHNQQNGLVILSPAASVSVVNCTFHSNGLAANNTYNNIVVTGTQVEIAIAACNFWLDGGVTNKVAYHIFYGAGGGAKTHGNGFGSANSASGTISGPSVAKDANETG